MTTLANCSVKMIALLQILKLEGKLLRAGKLADIALIIENKSKAMRDVEMALAAIPSDAALHQLRVYVLALDKMSKENGRLLQSVLAGARAAKARIANLQGQEAQVGTYDLTGKKHSLTNFSRRANKIV